MRPNQIRVIVAAVSLFAFVFTAALWILMNSKQVPAEPISPAVVTTPATPSRTVPLCVQDNNCYLNGRT